MSEIKSNSDDLVLNSDGGTSTIKFQTNGVERGSISTTGAFTATTIDATALTGALPAISGASLTNLPAGGVDGITSSAGSSTGIRIFSGGGVVIGDTTVLTTTHGSMLAVDGNETMSGGITIGTTNTGAANGNIAALAFSPIGFDMGRRRAAIWAVSKSVGSNVGYAADLCLGAYGAADGSSISTSHERLRIQSGGGISFNGDTAAANALNDYEEGDWTPAVTSTGGSLATTIGRYTKTGRVVHLFCLVVSSVSYTYANSTDLWTITGVPFAEAGQGYTGQPGSFYGRLNWNNSGSASTTNSIVTPTVSSTSIQFNVCNSADIDGGNARIKCANNASFVAQVNVTYYTNA